MKKFLATLLCLFLMAGLIPGAAQVKAATLNNAEAGDVEEAGWYLTDYRLQFANLTGDEGSYMQGGHYRDYYRFYDADGNELVDGDTETEGTVEMHCFRKTVETGEVVCGYTQRISWDSPESFLAGQGEYSWSGFSNEAISSDGWSCEDFSVKFWGRSIEDGYEYAFRTADEKSTVGITGDATLTCTLPSGIPGDKAYLVIDFNDEHRGYKNDSFYQAHAVYTYTWKDPETSIEKKTYTSSNDSVNKSGWYLTGYQFTPKEKLENISYFQGGSAIDSTHFYDRAGKPADSNSKLENVIYVYNERVGNGKNDIWFGDRYQLKWDSPQAFCAENEALRITNYSNTLRMTKNNGAGQVVMSVKKADGKFDGFFDEYLATPEGKSWINETGSTVLTCERVMPKGNPGNQLNLIIDIRDGAKCIYTYTWLDASKSVNPTLKSSKATLYLSGSKKKLTTKITVKNAKDYKVTYKSGNKKVATVSKTGKVTAKKAGKAKITVTFKKNGKTIKRVFNVTVKKK